MGNGNCCAIERGDCLENCHGKLFFTLVHIQRKSFCKSLIFYVSWYLKTAITSNFFEFSFFHEFSQPSQTKFSSSKESKMEAFFTLIPARTIITKHHKFSLIFHSRRAGREKAMMLSSHTDNFLRCGKWKSLLRRSCGQKIHFEFSYRFFGEKTRRRYFWIPNLHIRTST